MLDYFNNSLYSNSYYFLQFTAHIARPLFLKIDDFLWYPVGRVLLDKWKFHFDRTMFNTGSTQILCANMARQTYEYDICPRKRHFS